MAHILLVEDEVNIASFIERGLQEFGNQVMVAKNGAVGWELLQRERFDLLVLDVMIPQINGLQLCRLFREKYGYQTPIIMLTALGTTEDIVKGLDAGADDYLVKPFRFMELEARIKSLLRRAGAMPEKVMPQHRDLILDKTNRSVTREGKTISLTMKEYQLLEQLMINIGQAVSREELLQLIWEEKAQERTNVVDVYVNYLRGKMDKGYNRKLIRTVSGVGYLLEP
ncbi:response regulator transcription factor [Parabacteroides sp. OttesenSCG-928-N08]|nr:response regulator transcription factor [Parabacteroides sp. OttesenSCG-928-N08]